MVKKSQDSLVTRSQRVVSVVSVGNTGFLRFMVVGLSRLSSLSLMASFSSMLTSSEKRQNMTAFGTKYHRCLLSVANVFQRRVPNHLS